MNQDSNVSVVGKRVFSFFEDEPVEERGRTEKKL